MNKFLTKEYDHIVKMTEKITQDDNYREIAHYVIEQFMVHPRAQELVDKGEAMRFMSGMVWRSYNSSTSPYHKLYRQSGRVFAKPTIDDNRLDTKYQIDDDIKLEAIKGILEDLKAENINGWYIATLFEKWIETPNYSELARITSIPRTSISEAVNEAKQYIKQKLTEYGITN